jgi:hypothetical protein
VCETFISARDLMRGGHHVLLVCLVVLFCNALLLTVIYFFLDNALFTYLG